MKTKHWGYSWWVTLFSVAMTFPEKPTMDDMANYRLFYEIVGRVLPCNDCRRHYNYYHRKYPINPYLRNGRNGLFTWVQKVLNEVNVRLGKKQLSRQSILDKFFPLMDSEPVDCQTGGGVSFGRDWGKGLIYISILGLLGVGLVKY